MWEAGGWEIKPVLRTSHARFLQKWCVKALGESDRLREAHSGYRKGGGQSRNATPTSLGSQSRKAALFEGHWETLKASKQQGPLLVSYCG